MSEMAKRARQAMKGKIASLVRTDPKAKVDASGYTPPDALDADVKTGMRPISRRQFKKGGKVVAVHGKEAAHHAGKKPRKSGGRLLTSDYLINRNQKEANLDRDGSKHIGGMKRGGKAEHTDVAEDKKLIKSMVKKDAIKPGKAHGGSCRCAKCMGGSMHKAHGGKAHKHRTHKEFGGQLMSVEDNDKPPQGGPGSTIADPVERQRFLDSLKNKPKPKKRGGSMSVSDGSLEGTRPTGGRLARKSGGRTGKGKMNVNIVIGAHKPDGQGMMPPQGPQGPQGMPIPVPTGPGAAGPAGMPPMGGMPPGMMPAMPTAPGAAPPGMPMPRKSGGRVGYNPKQDGAGGGLGRLHKLKAYGKNSKPTKEHY